MGDDGPLDLIAAKLKPGCEFRLGTDDTTYCRWSMMVMNRRRDFRRLAATPHDFLTRPDDWPDTRNARQARPQGHEDRYSTLSTQERREGNACAMTTSYSCTPNPEKKKKQ